MRALAAQQVRTLVVDMAKVHAPGQEEACNTIETEILLS
jgi:hypothetical protein